MNGNMFGKKLEAVANELKTAAQEIYHGGLDGIGYYDEDGNFKENPKINV
jgi:hypothetical protein